MTLVKEVYSTYEIARIIHVAPRTVAKMIDAGKLPGHRIGVASRNHRRVMRRDLAAFLLANRMPLCGLDIDPLATLCVGLPSDLCPPGAVCVDTWLDAGVHLAGRRVSCLVVNLGMGRSDCLRAAASVRSRWPDVRLVAVGSEDETDPSEVTAVGYRLLAWPWSARDVAVAVEGGAGC